MVQADCYLPLQISREGAAEDGLAEGFGAFQVCADLCFHPIEDGQSPFDLLDDALLFSRRRQCDGC